MDWSSSRKLLYGTSFFVVVLGVVIFSLRTVLFPDPTCFDNKKNGFESGIDCGGTCSLRCSAEVSPLSVLWARALPVGNNMYDIVGVIENTNINNAPKAVAYTFDIYDRGGTKIYTYSGTTTVPVDDDKPIIIQNILLQQVPNKTILTIAQASHYAAAEKPTSPNIKVLRSTYEAGDVPRVYVTIQNTKQTRFESVPVSVILYDENQNAIAAGETIVPSLEREEQKALVFTWREPFTGQVARIRPYLNADPFAK
jgi:cytochrome c-type biogenesis protein CcmE